MLQKPDYPDFLDGPEEPPSHEEKSHPKSHVEIGIGRPQQRMSHLFQSERTRTRFSKPNGADAGYQPEPVRGQNEYKEGGDQRKNLRNHVLTHDPLERHVEGLDD